jgi:long-chain acyl-CoA synthetase
VTATVDVPDDSAPQASLESKPATAVSGDGGPMPTLATRVRDRARSTPNQVAMRQKELGIWREVTWASYWDTVLTVGHAMLALGVEPGDRVAIHSENRREWLFTDVATVAARGATVGLYPTNPPPEVSYLLSHSGAKILVVEDQEQLDKALAVLDECPDLERIIYVDPRGIRHRYEHPKLLSWEELLAMGAQHRSAHSGAIENRMAQARAEDIATVVYTSGTTGRPKGAMLSISNVEYAIEALVERGGFTGRPPNSADLVLSYLPLCHVAERIFTVWFNAGAGVQVNFAESIATVQPNLREVQPTILFGVPRIWERILASVTIGLRNTSPIKRVNARVWLAVADRIGKVLVRTGGRHTVGTRLRYAIGWVFFYRALRERIGMRRVRYAASGAAPIAPEVLRFFMGIGVPMHEVYGMTENTAVATANRPGRIRLGTVGEPHDGVEIRIDELTGEILTRHKGTFAGYFRDPEATAQSLTEDGWLHTGDIGEWVEGTHIRITDRAKDIIITAGGKNIAPSEIENALKTSPYIKEAIVIGDRRPYLVALIGIEPETVGDWAQRRNIAYTTYRDLSEKPEVIDLVRGVVSTVNERFASVEQIKKFRLLPKELDHEDGELTATQKVKRSAIATLFAELVDGMYRGGAQS